MNSSADWFVVLGATCSSLLPTKAFAAAEGGLSWGKDHTRVSYTATADDVRTYELATTHKLRDGAAQNRTVAEKAAEGQLRSGNVMFDALFAMAMEELRQDSVEEIVDEAFNEGRPVACHSFVAGEKWPYTWTRDTAYAIDLALGMLDPLRARDALLFKISPRRAGPGAGTLASSEIAQDTGSGGSWPVSADRVSWALGAHALMPYLDPALRDAFRTKALTALSNSLERDRIALFDPVDGLYRGEQSFLDWREQTYPPWTKQDMLAIATAKALSTNAVEYAALRAAAQWAKSAMQPALSEKYSHWADELKTALVKGFWLNQRGLFGTQAQLTTGVGVIEKFDMLGESLTVLHEIAGPDEAELVMRSYPHTPHGPPVIWPQNPHAAIYHNRAVWPFVTAYAVRAAAKVGNAALVTHNVGALVRLAALNLSHMENYEFLSGEPYVADGELSGPVVNSRRQLWSVAGYLGTVLHTLIGINASEAGLSFRPVMTSGLHAALFAASPGLRLRGLTYQGKLLDVEVILPSPAGVVTYDHVYHVAAVRLGGKRIPGGADAVIRSGDLQTERNTVQIELATAPHPPSSTFNLVSVPLRRHLRQTEQQTIFAPRPPHLHSVRHAKGAGGVELSFDHDDETDTKINAYRDGHLVARDITGRTWRDPNAHDPAHVHCYAITQSYRHGGAESHPARGMCIGRAEDGVTIMVGDPAFQSPDGASKVSEQKRDQFKEWGAPNQRLVVAFRVLSTGGYGLTLTYANAFGSLQSGVTAATKMLVVTDDASQKVVASGPVVMPHLASWNEWRPSSELRAKLTAGRAYTLEISDFFNMSYLEHFALYTGGPGGSGGPLNRASIAALVLTPR